MAINDFNNILKLTNVALLISGIKIHRSKWNYILESFIDQYLYYVNFIAVYTVIFGEIYWMIDGIQTGKSFVELSLNSPCITMSVLSTIKSISLYLNKHMLVNVVDELRNIHPNTDEGNEGIEGNTSTGDEKAEIIHEIRKRNLIVNESIKFLKTVIFLLLSVSSVVMVMFCLAPVLAMGYDHYIIGVATVNYPFAVKYSFDAYNTYWWWLIYLHQVWATVIVCMNIYGTDTLFYVLCSYIGMHFKLVGSHFENIVSNTKEETQQNINMAIRRHQDLFDLVARTQLLYSKSMFFNIIISSILICLSAFNITVAKELRTIFSFITFLTLSLSQIALLCLFGDMLMRASNEVSESIYTCRWYIIDNSFKKTLLIALIRAQRPCRLRAANFMDLNLGAFTTILSRSWSYFALLKTIYN